MPLETLEHAKATAALVTLVDWKGRTYVAARIYAIEYIGQSQCLVYAMADGAGQWECRCISCLVYVR